MILKNDTHWPRSQPPFLKLWLLLGDDKPWLEKWRNSSQNPPLQVEVDLPSLGKVRLGSDNSPMFVSLRATFQEFCPGVLCWIFQGTLSEYDEYVKTLEVQAPFLWENGSLNKLFIRGLPFWWNGHNMFLHQRWGWGILHVLRTHAAVMDQRLLFGPGGR